MSLFSKFAIAFFSIFLICSIKVNAQDNRVLKLKSGNYILNKNIDKISSSHLKVSEFQGNYYVYIHFNSIPTSEQKLKLASLGIEVLEYVPSNTFLSKVKKGTDFSQLEKFGIDGVYIVTPEFKMSYDVANESYPEHAVSGKRVSLIVQNLSKVSSNMMDAYYAKLGAKILSHYSYSNLTTVQINKDKVQKLASHPLVKYIEPIPEKAQPEDIVGQSNHRSNFISNPSTNAIPYNGSGVWLAIGDDGFLGPHIDYTGRIDQTNAGNSTGNHGDHVGGIMMGAGNLDPDARGMAWGADIMVYDVWDAVNSTPVSYFNPGVVVTSTSYGNGCNAGYTSFAQTADQQVRQMPNLMHVFSAGNSGSSNCGYGAGAGWGNITGGIKAGKNVLAVGNVTYLDALSSSSSRGPASDGRIKPDICANGTGVYSCNENNQYANSSGTSMAAPGVSGTYGQLVQAYRELNGGVTPTSALVKGTMLNTADDLGNIGPDFRFGWGRLNARKAVQVFENNTFMLDSISQNGSKQHQIVIPSNVSQVKIMVYWNDYEGSTVSTTALVNNLDMSVTNPSSATLLPYVLDPTPNPTNLNTPATNGVDSLNNMEQVVIDNPTAGTYTVNVNGTSIPQGPQKYYVIYEFITNEIIVTYPIGGEGFTPGTAEVIRWDAPAGTNSFTVEYSTDNGVNWNTLSTTVNPAIRYYNWNVSNLVTGNALVKVTRNGISGQSPMPFSIIGVPTNIHVTKSCPTSFDISWNAVSGATAYEVSVLGAEYMDSVTTVTTTSATVNGVIASNSYWVSVKALTADAVGKRAFAIQKTVGVWNCVLGNDIALTQLNSPSGNAFFDCVSYSNIPVEVTLKNEGTQPQTNFDIAYQFNNGSVVTETYSGTLNPGDSVMYTFSSTISFATQGQYNLDVWKVIPDDNVHNDTIYNPFEVYSGMSVGLPYSQDFENFNSCATTTNCQVGVCNLTEGWLNLSNQNWDDIDFRVDRGGTPSSNTGPSSDHNPGSTIGNYLYLEASGGCDFMEAQLISPCIDLSTSSGAMASIWYHMLGSDMGELHFDVLSDGNWYTDVVAPITGNNGNTWKKAEIDLTPFAGNMVNVRFRGITGDGYLSDLALDDFSVVRTGLTAIVSTDTTPCIDHGPISVTSGSFGNPTSYAWDFGAGATPSTASGIGPHSVTYSSVGVKDIELIISDGTFSDTAIQSVTVMETPTAQFTSNFNAGNGSMSFTNTSLSLGTSSWNFGDGTTSTDKDPVHTYPAKGYYMVTLIIENSCGSDTIVQRVDNFPLNTFNIQNQTGSMFIFPNPSNGMFSIQISGLESQKGTIQIINTQGKMVYYKNIDVTSTKTGQEINVSGLTKGVYIVKFESETLIEQQRIVIQ